jgi:tetratricopeptide (TPR) repeat protein
LILAQANLLRMRGRWDEAAEVCAEALRRQPRNAAAHSLLGDIYENRGRLDDAIHWYSLALDLNPGSVADQSKLARARELQTARSGRARGSATRAPFSWLRVATIAGMTACCTLLVVAIVISASERSAVRESRAQPSDASPGVVNRSRAHRSTAGDSSAIRWRAMEPSRTPRERRLLQGLLAPLVATPLRPVDLQLDPRRPAVTLTLLATPEFSQGASSATEEIGTRLQREVYRLAASLVRIDPSVAAVHARVLVPLTDSHDRSAPELVLVASLDAPSLDARADSLTASDLNGRFRDVWWGSSFTQ